MARRGYDHVTVVVTHEIAVVLLDHVFPRLSVNGVGVDERKRAAVAVALVARTGHERAELHRVVEAALGAERAAHDAVGLGVGVRGDLVAVPVVLQKLGVVDDVIAVLVLAQRGIFFRGGDDVAGRRHVPEGPHAAAFPRRRDAVRRRERTRASAAVKVPEFDLEPSGHPDVAAQDVPGVAQDLVVLLMDVDLERLGDVRHFEHAGMSTGPQAAKGRCGCATACCSHTSRRRHRSSRWPGRQRPRSCRSSARSAAATVSENDAEPSAPSAVGAPSTASSSSPDVTSTAQPPSAVPPPMSVSDRGAAEGEVGLHVDDVSGVRSVGHPVLRHPTLRAASSPEPRGSSPSGAATVRVDLCWRSLPSRSNRIDALPSASVALVG